MVKGGGLRHVSPTENHSVSKESDKPPTHGRHKDDADHSPSEEEDKVTAFTEKTSGGETPPPRRAQHEDMVVKHCDVTNDAVLGKVRSGRRRRSVGLTASRRSSLRGVPLLTSFAATPVIRWVWISVM
ncbi:uncharacterized protein [Procambarus clarkii]|uniref:uncharacterized protein isoform X2 n=1 Tax=Procambarus clarkii TaxID=6728 RepID=UPI003743AE54